jgi:asparagine synthase (glutamine-hydrolysing)
MCGIAGLYNFSGSGREQRDAVLAMRDAMSHRGPDDAGLWESPDHRVVLAHRRLSIVDLSPAGHQPMANEDDSVWITFNGEIYNHADLRPGLLAKGHRFRSRTDTEAIIHQYEEDGPECLQSLDGMFALGIWDAARERLMLARDRLGKKPLYYTVVHGKLLFASEIKGLLAHPDVVRDIDPEALNLYLTFSNVPAPHTLFAGIKKLPAAHRLLCDRFGNLHVERYWSPVPERTWPSHVDTAEAVTTVRGLLGDAVKKRLMADVPVGAFLSGGVDSSANVALMSKLIDRPLQTYSVGFAGLDDSPDFQDLPFARKVAKQFGCDHHEITITADECRDYLPELVYQQDEPIGDPACLPMHFLCKQARKDGVIVVLVGEGSDEVFGGYGDMVKMLNTSSPRWERLRRLPWLVRAGLHEASRVLRAPAGRTDVLRRARDGQPLYWGLDVVFWDNEKARLLTREARKRLGDAERSQSSSAKMIGGVYSDLLARQPGADLLQQMSVLELTNRLPELLLMRVDKLSMAHSIEARAPFLDYKLVSYGLSLPRALKIDGVRTKHVLKQALRGVLPDDVLDRPKQGFRVPLPAWLRGPLASWAKHEIFESPLAERGFFNHDYVDTLWRRHLGGVQDHSFDLWCLVNLGAWYAHWIDGRKAA